ncbi:MAG: hypothetical protein R3F14_01455 [Polyangiaceae bacterium]
MDLFRDTLGILVEVAPGFFAFAHQTLAEYFAAWELVRSDGLEKLVSRPVKLFDARYREVLLLALGVLGLLRGDDQRLASIIEMIARAADAWEGRPPGGQVPALLAGLLRDDPNLGSEPDRTPRRRARARVVVRAILDTLRSSSTRLHRSV